jgi:hypothetical protein
MKDNVKFELNLEEKKVQLQRMKIENLNLIGDVIKKFIEDFGKLIMIVGVILTMLSNLGLITYKAMSADETIKTTLDIPSIQFSETIYDNNVNNILPLPTMVNRSLEHRDHPDYLMRKIKKEIFSINNIILLIFTIVFVIPLLRKKKKNEKEMKSDAGANINTDKK